MIKTRYIIATLAVCAATISRAGTPVTYTKEDSIGIENFFPEITVLVSVMPKTL